MASLELEGTIVRKLDVQTGKSARGEWCKQEFIVEFPDGNFTSNAVFNVWGDDKVKDLEKFSVGEQVKVSFAVSSREFNGRWYTTLRAWRISPARQAGGPSADSPAGFAPASAGAPYGNAPAGFHGTGSNAPAGFAPSAPAPTLDDMPADDGGDDLPF